MLQLKYIVFLSLLFFAVYSCKKKQHAPPIDPPKTGIYKMEGQHVWKGILYIDYNPLPAPNYGFFDTSYEITFSDTIYVLSDSIISYAPDFTGDNQEDTLYLKFITTGQNNYYYFGTAPAYSQSEVISYYYDLDSFFREKIWINDSNWRCLISVHSP